MESEVMKKNIVIKPLIENYVLTGTAELSETENYLEYKNNMNEEANLSSKQNFYFYNSINIKFDNILITKNATTTSYQQFILFGDIVQIKYERNKYYDVYINYQQVLSNLQSLEIDKIISWDITINDKYYKIIIDNIIWAEGYLNEKINPQEFNVNIKFGASYAKLKMGEINLYIGEYMYLIKQNNIYYSIKPEFYKNINYNPLTLYGDAKPNLTDFEQFGFNDLISMKEFISTKMLKGKDLGVLGSGKYFEIELDSGCNKILSQPNILAEVEVTNSAWTNPMTLPLKVNKYQTVSFLLKDDNYSRFEFRSTYGGLYGTYVTYYSDGSSISNSDGSQELNDGTWNYTFKNMKLDETKMCNKINIQAGPRDDTSFVLFKIYKYYKLRYLIQYNSQLYTFDGNGLVLSQSQILDENNFIANGFSNVTLITEDMWNNRFPLKIGVKLLAYTDKIDVSNFDVDCSLTPFRPIDKFNKFNLMIKK